MNAHHISLLLQRQLKEQYRMYLIGEAVLIGLLSFLFLLVHQWRDSFAGAVQNCVFLIGLFLSGGLFTATMFHELAVPSKGIWLLCLPATQAEKVVSSILLSAIAFLVVYVALFYLVDVAYVLLTYKFYQNGPLDLFKNGFYLFFFT